MEKYMNQEMQRQIEEIMNHFDFEKCARAMTALDWKWRTDGVPSQQRIKEESLRLLRFIAYGDGGEIGSGGLRAEKFKAFDGTKDGAYALRLSFEVTRWEIEF
jgi:hypothetical protein